MSTRVGGVPEVLPPGLVEFAEPEVEGEFDIGAGAVTFSWLTLKVVTQDLVRAICRAADHVRSGRHDPLKAHAQLKEMYSWSDVAERTERVYYDAMAVPEVPIVERLRR